MLLRKPQVFREDQLNCWKDPPSLVLPRNQHPQAWPAPLEASPPTLSATCLGNISPGLKLKFQVVELCLSFFVCQMVVVVPNS